MAINEAEYGDISWRVGVHAGKKMLEHARLIQVLSLFGDKKPIPKNSSKVIKWRRRDLFGVATTPLTEGVTPTVSGITYTDVTATLAQYGDVHGLTDVVHDLAEDPVLNDMTMLCGQQAGETIEALTWAAVKAGTNVFYDTKAHTLRTDVDSKITLNRLRAVVASLQTNRAMKVTNVLSASAGQGTRPIEAAYIAVCHTDVEGDIRDLAGFTPVAEYGSRQPICPEEFGSVENVRFITSPMLSPVLAGGAAIGTTGMISAAGVKVDVYPIIIFGENAYGITELAGRDAIKPSVINPNTPTKDDPLGQRGYVGWKTYFVSKILNDAWLARLEVGATAR